MSYTLRNELTTDPDARGYASMTDAEAAADLNTPRITQLRERFVDARTVYVLFGPADGEAALQAFETVAETNPVIKRTLNWMNPDQRGVDVGLPAVRAMIDQLTPGVFSTEQAAALKEEGEQSISRAQQLGLGTATEGDVQRAQKVRQ